MPDKEKENMALWNAVWQTDPAYTKEVKYGARHFTTLDAYRQVMAATKMWGPVGKGWGWTAEFHVADALDWHIADPSNQRDKNKDEKFSVCWCVMELWYENRDQHFTTVGGAAVDRRGECQKKALTDAITKGLSYLGFNADVFLGMFDDNKYVADRTAACANEHRPAHSGDPSATGGHPVQTELASGASLQRLNTLGTKVWGKDGWEKARKETVTWASAGRVTSAAQMNQTEMNAANDYLESQLQAQTTKGQ